jgi:polyadenylate-binding protein
MYSIDNEEKLREKVDEAMNVYDEYVKNSGEGASEGDAKADGADSAEADAAKA